MLVKDDGGCNDVIDTSVSKKPKQASKQHSFPRDLIMSVPSGRGPLLERVFFPNLILSRNALTDPGGDGINQSPVKLTIKINHCTYQRAFYEMRFFFGNNSLLSFCICLVQILAWFSHKGFYYSLSTFWPCGLVYCFMTKLFKTCF